MRNNNPRNFYNLSAEQVVIGLFLQDKDFRSSVISYILGDNHIEKIEKLEGPLHAAFGNIIRNPEEVDLATPLINTLTNVFTQERSFFYILKQILQIINRDGVQRISRDNVSRYLEAYETAMEEVGQFCYMDLPIYIYENILNENSSTEERFVFSILTGSDPNQMQTQLLQNELRALFEIDETLLGNIDSSRLRTPRLLDVIIIAAVPESQSQLFIQISNLLTFIENQNLTDALIANHLMDIWLRYTIFRSAIDRRLNGFTDRLIGEGRLQLSTESDHCACEQAIYEGRVDVFDKIWNSLRTCLKSWKCEVK
ncbi:hypothetical protein [Wolbachia endosymbiont of Cimex lectularius]|uniref:hypothetical protein n=1 Tax=Wolbachia endosymbiont of Cimex lectularius TaxID=246273 RepID=UPI000499DBAB|nr:hypothetical protein [Wolbachia endosymbiont of Cimex lectularius]BAP00133.1 arsenical-resistance protein [Wolbachia endosymbiont of Cimex lectularius]